MMVACTELVSTGEEGAKCPIDDLATITPTSSSICSVDTTAGDRRREVYSVRCRLNRKRDCPSGLLGRRSSLPLALSLSSLPTPRQALPNDEFGSFPGYEFLDVLGRGASGTVLRAKRRSDKKVVAMKVIHVSEEERVDDARREHEILQSCVHPNIVKALDFFVQPCSVCIVMEYFQGPTLAKAVKDEPFAEGTARELFKMLVLAIAFLHEKRILHRDIKPANMNVTPDFSKLCLLDFGTAKRLTAGGSLTPTGTSSYLPPEVLNGSEGLSDYGDVWAAGLCLHFMLTGVLPWMLSDSASVEEFCKTVSNTRLKLDTGRWKTISRACKSVLLQCLAVERSARALMSELLKEEWLCQEFVRQVSGSQSEVEFVQTPLIPGDVSPLSPHLVSERKKRA